MYLNKLPLLFLLLIGLLSGCRQDEINTNTDRIPPITQRNVETTISGTVIDSDGRPIRDATISVINETTLTNQFGYFEITGLVGETQAVIKVEKQGYFNQFKALIPNEELVDRTRIRLLEKTTPQRIAASSGDLVTVEGGTTIDFQANSFIDEAGNPYTGEVSVYSFYIDPTDPEIDMIMPGNLMARNNLNERRLLESFGMVNVELEGSDGQKLDINQPATLTMDIPSSLVNNAPASIPLWYFDEATGLWMEEGIATLNGRQYVGTVNHFTFWNCDIDFETFTLLSGKVFNESGSPLIQVRITNISSGSTVADWTDDEGNFGGYVPMNESLLLEVVEVCGSTIHSETIGPFTTPNTDVGQIIPTNTPALIEITGILRDCDGGSISSGSLVITLPGNLYPQNVTVASDGSFAFTTTVCGASEIEIRANDITNFIIGNPVTYSVSPIMNLGTINICGTNISESVILEVGGETKIIPGCTVEISTTAGLTAYTFEFIDSLAGPGEIPIAYTWTFTNNSSNLNNPDWSGDFSNTGATTLQDSLIIYQSFVAETIASFAAIQEANSPGDILSFKFGPDPFATDIYIKEDETTTSIISYIFSEGIVTLNAKLQ